MEDVEGISTAADVKRLADERRKKRAEPITLPSGLKFMCYRPGPDWWLRNVGRLPTSLVARITGASEVSSDLSSRDLIEYSEWTFKVIQEIVISPQIRLSPRPDEIDPNWISDADLLFLIKYAGGEVSANGTSLETFPKQS